MRNGILRKLTLFTAAILVSGMAAGCGTAGSSAVSVFTIMAKETKETVASTMPIAGKATLRVTGADLLNEQTYGPSKTLVESNSPIAAAPTLELVASDGTPFTDDKGIWRVFLTDGGRKLKFGPVIGTRILVK